MSIYVSDVETGHERLVIEGSSGSITAIAFSPDGAVLATAANFEKGIRLWDEFGLLCRVIAWLAHSVQLLGRFPHRTVEIWRQRAATEWSAFGSSRRPSSVPY